MSDHTHATSQVVGRPSYSEAPSQCTYGHILEKNRMPANIAAVGSDSLMSVQSSRANSLPVDLGEADQLSTVFKLGPTPSNPLGEEAVHVRS